MRKTHGIAIKMQKCLQPYCFLHQLSLPALHPMECENLLLSQQILSPTQEVNIWEIFTLIVFRRRECGEGKPEIEREFCDPDLSPFA